MSEIKIEKFELADITEDVLKAAAKLFSESYGVWGPLAASKMGAFAKKGARVKMSAKILKQQCLPVDGRTVYVRVLVEGTLAGNVFATRWTYEGRKMCWITQLCVSSEYRNKGLAKILLENLREGETDRGFGILTSHPYAILAALRVYGRGPHEVDLKMTKEHAAAIMQSCPVNYVNEAKLHGSLFGVVDDGSVSCVDTAFWVDHEEPLAALESVRAKGIAWPFGDLPEGHEFLIIVKAKTGDSREGQKSSEF
jgi:hypothetical protein